MLPEVIAAAKEKRSLRLRALLQSGADPDQRDEHGETSLTWAARLGHTSIVKDLLAGGANIETRGSLFQATPVLLAARGGHRGIVALLAVHADLDARDPHGATALMRTFERQEGTLKSPRSILETARVLLHLGASLDLQDTDGATALMWAIRGGFAEGAALLIEAGADWGIKNSAGETALDLADAQGNIEMVALLHRLGVR